MVTLLETNPKARAVVNFSPIMLEQIADYSHQIKDFFQQQRALRDPLLMALVHPSVPSAADDYLALIKACLRVNEERLINRFPPYRRLADMAQMCLHDAQLTVYLSEHYLSDILVWYHLAWIAETVRRSDARIKLLIDKGQYFSQEDRLLLLTVMGELVDNVIGRYRMLAEQGRIEISMTPYMHPISPLLINMDCAREAIPDVALPLSPTYPGGRERARWHISKGKELFHHFFGMEPRGCWPSEGGVSAEAIQILNESGFSWAASGEQVLRNSLRHAAHLKEGTHTEWLYQPYQLDDNSTVCFFRDDGLSDLIGFTYSKWHSDDAVNNLVHHLENIAAMCTNNPNAIVSIIMDGENAWEYYPDNAYHFLTALYERLGNHEHLNLTTFSSYLDERKQNLPIAKLNEMVAGSWVYGTFSTWIGEPAKNRGWDMLCEAKQVFDKAVSTGRLTGDALRAAEKQLGICEGSDWFWWFGDYNPAETVSDFEKLFRLHLSNLYHLLGEQAPDYLSVVMSRGSGAPMLSGTMRPALK